MKPRVLFVCIHNSARSQMAEAFLKAACADVFDTHSAGLEPGTLNPVVVAAMKEVGVDISANRTKSVHEFLDAGTVFAFVITVCDETSAERCPVFPGQGRRLHWGFPDPSGFAGGPEERLQRTRQVRDSIREKVESWCAEQCAHPV